MTCQITPLKPSHLDQVQRLVNSHIDSLVPGWALPLEFIAERLERDPDEGVTDPWVETRATLVALDAQRVVAAAHLLRYGADTPGNGKGVIDWVLAWPDKPQATSAVLKAAHRHIGDWQTDTEGLGLGLPIPVFVGVPDTWPHIARAFTEAGYVPKENPIHQEAVFGGRLDGVEPPGPPPLEGLTIQRTMGTFGTRFTAVLDSRALSRCEGYADLSKAGRLPALKGWAELSEIETEEDWRNRGIGAWVVRHAVAWLRLGGCDRCLFSVGQDEEAAGAGRFYGRFGWQPMVRQQKWWVRRGD